MTHPIFWSAMTRYKLVRHCGVPGPNQWAWQQQMCLHATISIIKTQREIACVAHCLFVCFSLFWGVFLLASFARLLYLFVLLFIWTENNTRFVISIIYLPFYGPDYGNASSQKTTTHLSCISNTMAADELGHQQTLTYFSWSIPVLAPEGLTFHCVFMWITNASVSVK